MLVSIGRRGWGLEAQHHFALNPALATIDIHFDEIGARAVDQLLWRLQHREAAEADVLLRPTLLEGASA